jgi:amino acid transporter
LIIFLYLGANLAYSLMMPQSDIAQMKDTTVVGEMFFRQFGKDGARVAAAAVMCSVFGALNGNLLVGPRLVYAMGEDGLAPRALGTVHANYRTPALAILVVGTWSSTLVVLAAGMIRYRLFDLKSDTSLFNMLTDFAMFGSITFETLAVAMIFVFRKRLPDVERQYRCWGYPVVPALYVLIMAMVAVNMFMNQQVESLTGLGFIGLGALVYFLAVPRQPERQKEQEPVAV